MAVKTRGVVGPNSKSVVRALARVAVVGRIAVTVVRAVRVAMTSAAMAAVVVGVAATVTRGITTLVVSTGIIVVGVKPSRPQPERDVVALWRQAWGRASGQHAEYVLTGHLLFVQGQFGRGMDPLISNTRVHSVLTALCGGECLKDCHGVL